MSEDDRLAVIAREPDARCDMCQRVGGAYCDHCAAAVFAVHDLWREYESLSTTTRGAVSLIENAISGVENLPMQDAIEYLRGEWLTSARHHLGGQCRSTDDASPPTPEPTNHPQSTA